MSSRNSLIAQTPLLAIMLQFPTPKHTFDIALALGKQAHSLGEKKKYPLTVYLVLAFLSFSYAPATMSAFSAFYLLSLLPTIYSLFYRSIDSESIAPTPPIDSITPYLHVLNLSDKFSVSFIAPSHHFQWIDAASAGFLEFSFAQPQTF